MGEYIGTISDVVYRGIRDLREQDACTDFEIETAGKTFRCHKVVLAAVSDFFRAMFNSGMKETELNKAKFEDISTDTFETLFSLLYSQNHIEGDRLKQKSEEEMTELLNVAVRLQINFLKDICVNHFESTMSTNNCVERWKVAQLELCDEVRELAYDHILEHVEGIANDDILMTLDFEDFLKIISSEKLKVSNEEIVWKMIKKWVNTELNKRLDHFVPLLRQCCLFEIDNTFLIEKIACYQLVRKNNEASDMVRDALRYKCHPSIHGNLELEFRLCRKKQMSTVIFQKNIESKKTTKESKLMPTALRKKPIPKIQVRFTKSVDIPWLEWPILAGMEDNIACCTHGDSVYVTGGSMGLLMEFKSSKMKWVSRSDMVTPLTGHTMVATDGYLYVIGGRSGYEPNANVYVWSVEDRGDWRIDGDIMAPVIGASSVAVNDKIYIFGGEIGHEPADCVQLYDTKTKSGTIFCSLPAPCEWSRALCRGIDAYIVSSCGDVVTVDIEKGTSKVIASIPDFRRKYFGVDLRQGKVNVFGGKDLSDTMKHLAISLPVKKSEKSEDAEDETPVFTTTSFDGVYVIDVNSGEVKTGTALPGPVEVLGCVNLIHSFA
ncbi:ectoderm-neural cortex protein 1-like [Mya arenaria]|uniref:ectoderm-neural cortex protein 1-like n=1 Tax=Mya arenaria TaxID=6604 RepID=UPI0022E55ECC|nr:ectoderm-neural cortex protein 1-like [Mya arenaria]